MKKILILSMALVLVVAFLAADPAQAWHRQRHHHGHFSFGFFVAPPVVVAPPPIYYRSYPSYDYYDYGYREWVPGYWGWRRDGDRWERDWVPGYWRSR
jgi:hypothetical protein